MNPPLLLRNSRLKIEIARPDASPIGSRWDRSGFIRQITLDERHTFCGEEGGGNWGAGLCSEFGMHTALGYNEIAPGEWFPKLGIGLVRRLDDGPYDFSENTEVKPFPLFVDEATDWVRFRFEPVPCLGFAARFEKTVSVDENRLRVECRLENVGERLIRSEEYNHNFLRFNERETGAGYHLRSSMDLHDLEIENEAENQSVKFEPQGLAWRAAPQKAFYGAMNLSGASQNEWWELRNDQTQTSVRETGSSAPIRFALFVTARAICPEMFVSIEVEPNQTQTWTREWTFGASRD